MPQNIAMGLLPFRDDGGCPLRLAGPAPGSGVKVHQMIRISLKPYPSIQFEGPLGLAGFMVGALALLAYALTPLR